MNKYKFSTYNYELKIDNEQYLFNSLSGAFGKLRDKYLDILKGCNMSFDNFPDKLYDDKEFFETMKDGGFIVHNELDELEYIKANHYLSRFGNKKSFGITIAPTLACNFRCTYCFEKNNKYPPDSCLNDEVANKIIELVEEKTSEGGMLQVNWYGGEPLLELDRIKEMQNKFNIIAKKKNAKIGAGIITNGYLLTKDVINQLLSVGITMAQVTLDGSEKVHNKRRPLIDGRGSYKKIIDNLTSVSDHFLISLRVNVDKDNVKNMEEFLNDLSILNINNKKNISIYFSMVRETENSCKYISSSCYSVSNYSDYESNLYKLAMDKGFTLSKLPRPFISNCGAIAENAIVVEPDGGLQKCWNVIGQKDKRVGHLLEDNETYRANRLKWLAWDGFNDKLCETCKVLPLCMGGCPYLKLYDIGSEYSCDPINYNLKNILELIVRQNKISIENNQKE